MEASAIAVRRHRVRAPAHSAGALSRSCLSGLGRSNLSYSYSGEVPMKALMGGAVLCTIAMAAQTACAADSSIRQWSLDTGRRTETSERSFAAGSEAAPDWRDPRMWGDDRGANQRGDY